MAASRSKHTQSTQDLSEQSRGKHDRENGHARADSIRVVPITDAPWHDVRTVFGTRGDPASCWCQYFKLSGGQWRGATIAECEAALHEQSAHDPGPGLLAYEGDEPVGWVAVEPRTQYSRLQSSKVVKAGSGEPADDPRVWAITCFVVRVGFRRRGIAAALLTGALEHARASGARVVEAYPVDTAERKASASDLYHGVMASFVDAGFDVVARPVPGRAVVRFSFDG